MDAVVRRKLKVITRRISYLENKIKDGESLLISDHSHYDREEAGALAFAVLIIEGASADLLAKARAETKGLYKLSHPEVGHD